MHIEPSEENGRRLMERGIDGPVTMLNLLRFRAEADYSSHPELAPDEPISGREAYEVYAAHTRPFLAAVGGELRFVGAGGFNLIGPSEERWDLAFLVRYESLQAFMAMAQNPEYLAGTGHRSAALEDSRLLPIVELDQL
jgi:uncharacterized protein (DUF1330 family)